ncbi:MAG: hypothetical protein LBR53_03875 [Deltaproteobacteria bacterium]|jgi:uncharacterized Zn finger protein|nr:hypothetical protein [Deltaproteobacteria bacterium]
MGWYRRRRKWYHDAPTAAQKRAVLKRETARLGGPEKLNGVSVRGKRNMADTFWGKMWCGHFEGMADFSNRLPRGRTYARNGSIIHLDITAGKVSALVTGRSLYKIDMTVAPLPGEVWENIKRKCQGEIGTMLDLLNGTFSPEVMKVVCDPDNGVFPRRGEIKFKCSCPDWAELCKHLAAVFYGIGSRLDTNPELLFVLRQVNPGELLSVSAGELEVSGEDSLSRSELSDIFGVTLVSDMSETDQEAESASGPEVPAALKRRGRPPKEAPAAPAALKRRGRPPKEVPVAPAALKRRGRPPKEAPAAPAALKRRGRPPKEAPAAPAALKRRGRPPKEAPAAPAAAKRPSRPPKEAPTVPRGRRLVTAAAEKPLALVKKGAAEKSSAPGKRGASPAGAKKQPPAKLRRKL